MKSKKPNPLRLSHPPTRHGTESEQRVAKSLGARLTPGSGSRRGAKGDSRLEAAKLMVESKATNTLALNVEHAWLVKLAEEALAVGQRPAITLSFTTGNGEAKKHGDWVAIPLWMFKEWVTGEE